MLVLIDVLVGMWDAAEMCTRPPMPYPVPLRGIGKGTLPYSLATLLLSYAFLWRRPKGTGVIAFGLPSAKERQKKSKIRRTEARQVLFWWAPEYLVRNNAMEHHPMDWTGMTSRHGIYC